MDPCCGRVISRSRIRHAGQMRMEEEALGEAEAAEAVLRDNVFGLELDPRCTHIVRICPGAGGMEARWLPSATSV